MIGARLSTVPWGITQAPAQPPPQALSTAHHSSGGQLAGPTVPCPTATRPRRAHPLILSNDPHTPGRPTGERVPGRPVQPPTMLCQLLPYA